MIKGDRIKTTVGLSLTDKMNFLEGEIISIDKVKCFVGSELEMVMIKLDDGRVLPCLKEELEVIRQSNLVETISREDINKQAYHVMTNINSTKIISNISDRHRETLMNSFYILLGMFNDFIKQNDKPTKYKVMEIKTKFNLNDTVYPIQLNVGEIKKTCGTCKGNRTVKINNTERDITCTDCNGTGYNTHFEALKWGLSNHVGKIGKVSVELYSNTYPNKNEYRYMLDSTGVGSGTNWLESELFLTEQEAIEECEKRNNISTK